MRFEKYIVALLLFFSFQIGRSDTTKIYRIHPNDAFSFGERLSFEINYGFLTCAEAFLIISPSSVLMNGRDTYETSLEVNSRSSFEMVYKVRDNYKTFIDIKGIFPWKFEQHIRETNFNKDLEVYFRQDSLRADAIVNYGTPKSYQVPEYVQDLISAFYFVRTLDFKNSKKGDIITVPIFSDDKTISLQVYFEGREEIDVPAGEFRAFILKPELTEGFTKKTSDIYVWLTDDDRKIPVKVKMKIVIGALVAELIDYTGLNGLLNSKIED